MQTNSVTRFNKADIQQTTRFIEGLIGKAFTRAGQTLQPDDLNFMTLDLAVIIKKNYWFFTPGDVENAFDKGIFGEFGDYYGLNVRTFESWLHNYHKLKIVNCQYQRAAPDRRIESSATLTTAEIDRMMRKALERELQTFRQTGTVHDFGNAVYDWLNAKGEINIPKQTKHELMRQARKILISQAKQKANSVQAEFKIPYINVLRELEESPDADKRIISQAKRLALQYHFKTAARYECMPATYG